MFDVIIVGGGPAGLNAALVLGRSRRSVLVIDHGKPRNAPSHAMHGFLSRDGINPRELLKLGRTQLKPYGVKFCESEVLKASKRRESFEVQLFDKQRFRSKKLLLATGLRDQLPRIEGFTDLYGTSIHHCPYCDGWEWRDRAMAAFGHGRAGMGLALLLKGWSDDVVVLTDGVRISQADREKMHEHDIAVHTKKIAELRGRKGRLREVVFVDGSVLKRDAMFFNTGQRQKSDLAAQLGCDFDRKGGVITDKRERTCVRGLYLAGDASKDMEFVICAAAQGAIAAVAINKELQEEEGRVL